MNKNKEMNEWRNKYISPPPPPPPATGKIMTLVTFSHVGLKLRKKCLVDKEKEYRLNSHCTVEVDALIKKKLLYLKC